MKIIYILFYHFNKSAIISFVGFIFKEEGTTLSLSDNIMSDMKQAMKEHDKIKLNTVRMIKSALMNEKIKLGHELNSDEDDLAEETKKELAVVESYMPKQLSKDELEKIVKETVAEVGAKGKSDFGKVMKSLMPKVKGRADGKEASAIVRDQLN